MSFGPVALDGALGAVLAHAVDAGGIRLKKGTVLGEAELAALRKAGIAQVIAAVPAPDDLGEDDAARRIAAALKVSGVEVKAAATGRVNIHAAHDGVFTVSRRLVDSLNGIDPSITLATLADYAPVIAGQMVATVKIIPFHVGGALIDAAITLARADDAFSVHAYRSRSVGLVQTVLPATKASVLDKTAALTAARLARSGSTLGVELRTAHEADAVAKAIQELAPSHDMVIVFGASAMSDPGDVIPAAIRQAGGEVERAGMPVDPGNLLVLGSVGHLPVIGAPGCARSPKENGFDWVLDRLMAGIPVTDSIIAGMGVGGLLMEIPTRPQPRESKDSSSLHVPAIILAAGRSSRMGGSNKLMALFDGEPLVRRVSLAAIASQASAVHVVTGHQQEFVASALAGLDIHVVENANFATGLASSLKVGLDACGDTVAGALVILGDMPEVDAAMMDRIIAAFAKSGGTAIVRAAHEGKPGNPVLLPRSVFAKARLLTGDTGARYLIESSGLPVIDIELGQAAFTDVDTPEALKAAGGLEAAS